MTRLRVVDRGDSAPVNNQTGTWLNDYRAELEYERRAPTTIRLRCLQLRVYTRWLADRGIDATAVTRAQIVAFLGRFASAETATAYRSALRGWHSWLMDTGRTIVDPTRRLPTIQRPEPTHRVIPDAVVLDVLASCSERQAAAVLLGRFAGLRASEIAQASHRYLQHGLDGPVVRLCGKGSRWRELPAHREVERVLSVHGWLFPGRDGQPISADGMSHAMSKLLPGEWTAHSLRHAFATEAYARTRDLRLVQMWLGHADPRTTVRYVAVAHDHSAMARLHLVA